MKLTSFLTTLNFALVYGQGSTDSWAPAGLTDVRGPCPMLNTLANHGFLPHDGRNITKDNAVHALSTALNFDTSLAAFFWEQGLTSNPEPNATSFTLGDLSRHNILEHDASLSRSDAYFGNNRVFNPIVFAMTRAFWTAPILDVNMLANSKLARQLHSKAYNPEYTFTSSTEAASLAEVAAPIIVFGDHESATVQRSMVEYFFRIERLPTTLGWTKQANTITFELFFRMSDILSNAASLITTSPPVTEARRRRRNLHSGF